MAWFGRQKKEPEHEVERDSALADRLDEITDRLEMVLSQLEEKVASMREDQHA